MAFIPSSLIAFAMIVGQPSAQPAPAPPAEDVEEAAEEVVEAVEEAAEAAGEAVEEAAEAAAEAAEASAEAAAEAAEAAAEQAAADEEERMICRLRMVEGDFGRQKSIKVCKTKAQWEASKGRR